MKKLISVLATSVALVSTHAAVYKEIPLLNGWNLYVTNGAAITGATNNLSTYIHGEVFYSLTNNMGNTNAIAPDAFASRGIPVRSDANGDIVANSSIHYYIGNTNWIPVVTTNSQGQYFVSNSWPLLPSGTPIYMYPATTNYYPTIVAAGVGVATFNFQRGWQANGEGGLPIIWDSVTNSFTFSVTTAGATPVSGATNPPLSWLQGAQFIRLHSVSLGSSNAVINQVSFGQPEP